MTWQAIAIGFTAMTLTGCSAPLRDTANEPQTVALSAPQSRISDSVIKADRDYLGGLQARLEKLGEAGLGTDGYGYCKAQAWLDMAVNEFYENDRSGVVARAARESARVITALEDDQAVAPGVTPIFSIPARTRDDLWRFIDEARAWTTTECASCELAYLEVQLIWIDHEKAELGWRHALPANQAADRLRREIDSARDCSPAPAPEPVPVVVIPEPAPVKPPPEARLPHFVHFGSDSSDLAPASLPRITAMAKVLRERPALAVRVEGYADMRGSDLYNLKLAQRRAESVRDALVAHGVGFEQLSTVGIGESNPRSDGTSAIDYARNRRVELIVLNADEPVKLDLAEVDLQLEFDLE